MSYQLNKTDGTLLTDLIDGQIDTNSTNLVLVGRNYSGYGEFFNENFIKLLENFANTAAPSNPITGQLWWDTSDQRLKVYDGTVWKASGGPFVQNTPPQMVAGDLWIDTFRNQLYAFDGTDLILVGPQYTEQQGESGFRIGSILDEQSLSRTVAYLYIGGQLVGVFSNLDFTPIFSQRIPGLVTTSNPNGTIFTGFNVIDKENFRYRGIAESANALVTASGQIRTADSFLPSNANGITTGTLTIQNSGGLAIGLSQNHVQKVVGPRVFFENQLTDHDISLRVRSSAFGALTVDGIYIDASTARVGIFNINRLPQYTLDVEGDLRVTGNLLVEGATTSIDVATLRIEDKNIEIAKTSTGSTLTGLNADNAGLILDTSDVGQKLWTWKSATDAWSTNVNVDITDTAKTYKIGGVDKLTSTSLTNIQKALDLDEIGTLLYLNVDSIGIDGTIISSNAAMNIQAANGINITGAGNIAIQDNQKITGLANPESNQDATTKIYVDTQIATEAIALSFDITGLGTGVTLQNAVASYLNDIYPASIANNGKVARIHAVSYAGATVSGINISVTQSPNTTGVLTKSLIAVDSNGTQNESVVQDIVLSNTASGVAALTAIRSLMIYQSTGSVWQYQSTTTYS